MSCSTEQIDQAIQGCKSYRQDFSSTEGMLIVVALNIEPAQQVLELAALMENGLVTSVELVEIFTARLKKYPPPIPPPPLAFLHAFFDHDTSSCENLECWKVPAALQPLYLVSR